MRAILLMLAGVLALATASSDKKVVCYYGSWAGNRQGNGQFKISDIDTSLCTHLVYSFVLPKEDGSIEEGNGNSIAEFNKLKEQNPALKTMIAIGGWTAGSATFSRIAANPATRKNFVQNIYNLVKKYGLDGFDVDWEYPGQRDGAPADKENLVQLLKELKEKFAPEGLILSAAVALGAWSAGQSYNIPEISKYLDFINLMAYDIHGSWEPTIGIHAPLYAASWETEKSSNIDSGVKYWIQQGAPAEKLVLGTPFYGKGFTLANPQSTKPGSPSGGASLAGPYSAEGGVLNYNEICEKIKNDHWQVEYEEEQRVPYAFSGNQWVGYDDERSLTEKAKFVKSNGLGGMMVWAIDGDDFRGVCGNEKYPLLKTINNALRGGVAAPVPAPAPPKKEVSDVPSNSVDDVNRQEPLPNDDDEYQQNHWQQNNFVEPQQNNNYDDQQNQLPQNNNEEPQYNQNQQQPSGSSNVCSNEGYYRDSTDFNKFYYCQFYNGEFIKYDQQCGPGLVYDTCLTTCVWPDQAC